MAMVRTAPTKALAGIVYSPSKAGGPVDAERQDGAQACAGGHADQVGVSQRVAEQPLVGCPAARQRCACQQHQQRVGQADLVQDGLEGLRPGRL